MAQETSHAEANAPLEVVALKHISKRFGSTRAVKDVSLAFRAGEVHAILGENGAGKSTVGKVIGGLVHLDEGTLFVDGLETQIQSVSEARQHGVAMVFQELSLVPDLTVRENIFLGTEAGRHPFSLLQWKAEEERCRSLFAEHNFDFDIDALVSGLSIANQQLVEVVKALARKPRVLILDEPTAMLGVREKKKLLDIIRGARSQGMALIFITHHVEEVVEVADRVSLMKDGAVVHSFMMTSEIDAAFIVGKLVGKSRSMGGNKQVPSLEHQVFAVLNLPGLDGKRVDISISAGEIVGLYGVVGSGCETIGRAAVGLANVHPSMMTLMGKSYRPNSPAQSARVGVSYLPSGRATNCVLPSLSTRENLMISQLDQVQAYGIMRNGSERELTKSLLARFRTRYADFDDPITSLSGGNQQKVMIARSLGRECKLIVLEDPTAGVDIGSKQDIHDLVRERAASGLAVFLISSDLLETIAISDVIYSVIDGKIVCKYEHPTIAEEASIIADVLGA